LTSGGGRPLTVKPSTRWVTDGSTTQKGARTVVATPLLVGTAGQTATFTGVAAGTSHRSSYQVGGKRKRKRTREHRAGFARLSSYNPPPNAAQTTTSDSGSTFAVVGGDEHCWGSVDESDRATWTVKPCTGGGRRSPTQPGRPETGWTAGQTAKFLRTGWQGNCTVSFTQWVAEKKNLF